MKRIHLYVLSLLMMANCTLAQSNDYAPAKLPTPKPGEAVATFAGGCFWALEEGMNQLKGVREVISGYAGGNVKNPTYEQVGTDQTGHAESVQVYYDPTVITYAQLLDAFFAGHDPTTLNRQGPDAGRDYRSVAFYRTPAEKAEIQAAIKRTNDSKHYANRVVTEVTPITVFYPAENYHQNYFALHPDQPYIQRVSLPKVEKLRKAMTGYLKNSTSLTMN
ncbi:peptide-methionine (S)-S-oxide reductase MsrA [Spirosoma utsteinense]|uniref:Peptide methionine sulfoxide reductase MsrA n=1 Tax=Spirosoma utsteinense TaxID=2585773 RepID=A0ABR6W0F0_9BACT|nr:peptide-methionine (S)-S-oxide reductase MsrA [Spirosoma utsteinense]MBC3788119.1 peptide-methionine (S)-S-oxide reductase [Spirosoma utsteinense]MBC3790020.1 peptide-methionine (S)-S-oxide reductase [Spirosoma utsteinense]